MRRNQKPATTLASRLVIVVLLLALLTTLVPLTTSAAGPQPEKVHGFLKRISGEAPGKTLPIIVQMSGKDGSVEREVEALGGRVVQSMGSINAFAAEVSGEKVAKLAAKTGVKWISYDAPVVSNGVSSIETSNLASAYPFALMAPAVWNELGLTGKGVTVAVIDSGVESSDQDVASRLIAGVSMVPSSPSTDEHGHGTHMAGIIAGNGSRSNGKYVGVAPGASLLSVKVSNPKGVARTSDVIRGLLWVVANRDRYGVKVINLSLSSSVPQSYLTDPLDAAVEYAWFNGIVVVASAGNLGSDADATKFAPGNDPFVITVGSVDDAGTSTRADDAPLSWSSRGKTQDGFAKPDVVAPGRRIVSLLSRKNAVLAQQHPDFVVDASSKGKPSYYFRIGGTSTSAAAVAGVVALMLQANPSWTPDQVKWQLMNSSDVLADGSRYARADRAVKPASSPQSANNGIPPSLLLLVDGRTGNFNNVAWDNVAWNNVAWNNVAWNNVAWNNVAWNNVAWNNVAWNNVAWNNVAWDNVAWNNVAWNNVAWNNVAWNNVAWDNVAWDNVAWDNVAWDGAIFD